MSKHYLAHTAEELDEAVEKVLAGYKDVTGVTASAEDVRVGKKIVDTTGAVKEGTLNPQNYYNDGYNRGLEEATPTLQSKEVIPSLINQNVTADSGFDGLSSVLVNAVPKNILDAEYQKGYAEASGLYKPYKQDLSYIRSSGVQYINSNFYPSGKAFRVVIKFRYTTSHDGLSLFGNATGGQFAITVYGSKPVFYVGTSNAVSCGPQTSLNTLYTLDVTANGGTLTAIWNGTTYTASYSGNLRTDRPMFIFGSNNGGVIAETGNGYQLESIKFYDNGVLVRDYIPVLDWDSVPCMYEKVKKKMYYNAGTGSFTYA